MNTRMSEAIMRPDNLNYRPAAMTNGRYRLRKVYLNNIASQSVTLSATGTTLVEWKLPANTPFNLGRSAIEYTNTLTAPAAAGFNWSFEDTFEICSSIQFCNASGVYLTDLQYANNYVSAVRKIDISQDDFEGGDYCSDLYKATAPASNFFPPSFTTTAGNPYTGECQTAPRDS